MNDTILFQFLKYNLVGVVNTLLGFGLVFTFLYLGINNMLSNFLGYFFGIILSFFLNKKYTFHKYKMTASIIWGFFTILMFAYLVNALIFWSIINYMDQSPYVSQIYSGIFYTLISFSLMKIFLFNNSNRKSNYEK